MLGLERLDVRVVRTGIPQWAHREHRNGTRCKKKQEGPEPCAHPITREKTMTDHTRPGTPTQIRAAANDDFKRSFSSWFWGSMIAATAVHFLAFAMWPQMSVDVASNDKPETPILDIPSVEVPEPPPPISRPATPVIADNIDPGDHDSRHRIRG